MTRFSGGPADGVSLMLRRSPIYLRVCRAADGTWDALDQLGDEPREGETLAAYRLVRDRGTMHVLLARPRRGPWVRVAEYAVCPEQPEQAVMSSRGRWRAWAEQQHEIDRDRPPAHNPGGQP